MNTRIINSSDTNAYMAALPEVVRALEQGALVVIPTETVYGVAANANHPEALRRLRAIKQTDGRRPFTVHLGRRADAARYVSNAPPIARRLARKAWPGPLTLVLEEPEPANTAVGQACDPNSLREIYFEGTVGLRCPDHPATQRLLGEAQAPIVASSANPAGQPPPLDLAAALQHFDGQVDFAIDGSRTRFSRASTVAEVRGRHWRMIRAGSLDERMIGRLARSTVLFVCTGNSCRSPMAEYLFRSKLAAALEVDPEDLELQGYHVKSAGTAAMPGAPASSGSRDEMARRGTDIAKHRAQPMTVELIQDAERIYAMSPEHRAAVIDLVPSAAERTQLLDPAGPITDPIGGDAEAYAQCAAHIERQLDQRLREFLDEDRTW